MADHGKSIELSKVDSMRFSSLKDLDVWCAETDHGVFDRFRRPRESLQTNIRTRNTSSKTDLKVLVCHDFKGGYQYGEDDCPLGYFPHEDGERYFLQFPSLVDTFIYFSHHRVTVPPVSWINMLHRHGIPCLGTLILEGAENRDLDRLVERDENGEFVYVEKLIELTLHYGFDGWLINVETTFARPSAASEIVLFTESLRAKLHTRVIGSQVIWYDAFIAKKNRVFYQNGVNELNFDHFDSSDYFFTNYWWDETTLKKNILNIGLQGTKKKLFVGIDIWGRGSKIGKGGFDVGLAINFLRVYSSNVALFAPAWSYENFDKSEFLEKDRKFWTGDMSDANPGGSVGTYIAHATAPIFTRDDGSITFYTNFCQGQGNRFKVMGKTVYDSHWVNGSLQMAVPHFLNGTTLSITADDAFNAGSCLHVSHKGPISSLSSENGVVLFSFETDVSSKDINISLGFKQTSQLIAEHFFQLEIEYYIERRYRSVTRVRDGAIRVPLRSSHSWRYLETTFSLPNLQPREHFVLSGVRIKWTNSTAASMGDVEQSWVLIENKSDPNAVHDILLGDLLIESSGLRSRARAVSKITKNELENGDVFVEWGDDNDVLMWLLYENAKFIRPLTTPCYVSKRGDRLKVDIITRSGKLVPGSEIFV